MPAGAARRPHQLGLVLLLCAAAAAAALTSPPGAGPQLPAGDGEPVQVLALLDGHGQRSTVLEFEREPLPQQCFDAAVAALAPAQGSGPLVMQVRRVRWEWGPGAQGIWLQQAPCVAFLVHAAASQHEPLRCQLLTAGVAPEV